MNFNFFKSYRHGSKLVCWIVLAVAVFAAAELLARAGGGGGGSSGGGGYSGGGGDGDGIGILIYLFFRILLDPSIPWPFKIVLLGGIGAVGYFMVKSKIKHTANRRVRGHVGAYKAPPLKKLASVDTAGLEEKAKKAFFAIQKAWESQNLSEVRRFISDGVYQRFNTQFKMMALLKQKNYMSEVRIESVTVDKVEKDGPYEIAHLRISAWSKDRFVCEIDASLNQEFAEGFVEYWSFMRLKGAPQKDMYDTSQCPACAAPLQKDMGELGKCAYCNTLINTGEFDWVLSEITQVDDYAAQNAVEHMSSFVGNMKKIRKKLPNFCIQAVEDKASNGYLQMLTAAVYKKPEIMRRFVSDEAFTKVVKNVPASRVVYNRLFLNKVTTVGAAIHDGKVDLYMVVGVSSQRVEKISETEIKMIDPMVYTKNRVIVLSGSIEGMGKKGSLYAHHCPSCGGSLEDSLDIKCPYCGIVLNSGEHDWVISQIYSMSAYMQLRSKVSENKEEKDKSEVMPVPKPVAITDLYDVKDYAFNNMMVVMGADGVFAYKEREMAQKIAKEFGFEESQIKELFAQALARRLTLRMPVKIKDKEKVIALMEKAASVDGKVSASESAIIDQARDMAA